jgi:hypothetical protein
MLEDVSKLSTRVRTLSTRLSLSTRIRYTLFDTTPSLAMRRNASLLQCTAVPTRSMQH